MLRVFQNDILDPKRFIITVELVPGRATGRQVGRQRKEDGGRRICRRPGLSPFLSPTTRAEIRRSVLM